MKFTISAEFDIEQDEIPHILRKLEDLAYELGCIRVLTYQDSGHCIKVDGQHVMSHAHTERRREREDEEEDN